MPQGPPLAPHADLLAVEVGDLLGVQEPVDPEERRAVADGARAVELLAADQEAAAAGGVHHPAGAPGDLPAAGLEAEVVRPRTRLLGQLHVQVRGGMDQLEVGALAVLFQDRGLELVAVELVGGDVGDLADVGLAEVLPDAAAALGLPVEAEVVLEEVLPQQVLLHFQHPRVVVAAHLDRGFPHLLLGARDLRLAVDHQDVDVRFLQQQVPGQGQTGEARSNDQDIHFARLCRHLLFSLHHFDQPLARSTSPPAPLLQERGWGEVAARTTALAWPSALRAVSRIRRAATSRLSGGLPAAGNPPRSLPSPRCPAARPGAARRGRPRPGSRRRRPGLRPAWI